MATCEKLEKCPFYQGKMSMESGLGSMYKKKYCEGDKMECARYMVATQLGPEYVTNHLYPNMKDQASKMIEENKK
ncbi:MAG: hypothetical protein IJ429_00090 [Lachnospiraceae bacterium]|nr:hypothetical protein [Lachnospiraceae bacterium]